MPTLLPDYTNVTIPVNSAPLNFFVEEKGDFFYVKIEDEKGNSLVVSSRNGVMQIPGKKWKKLLNQNKNSNLNYTILAKREGEWFQYESFSQKVSADPVDPFLYYRLLHPGYESWTEISIVQRNLESFKERTVVENNIATKQICITKFFLRQRDVFGSADNQGVFHHGETGCVKFATKTTIFGNRFQPGVFI